MRKPNLEEFFDETTGEYDFEEYSSIMGDYEDSERDREIEEKYKEQENEEK